MLAVRILRLGQVGHLIEEYVEDFLQVAHLTLISDLYPFMEGHLNHSVHACHCMKLIGLLTVALNFTIKLS